MSEHAPSGQDPATSPTTPARANPRALALPDAARLLAHLGGQGVTVAMLENDVAAGCPTNADGSLNLVAYAAWLVRSRGSRGD